MIKKIEMLLPVRIAEGNLAHFRGKIRKRTESIYRSEDVDAFFLANVLTQDGLPKRPIPERSLR